MHAEDVPLPQIAETVGTPVYVYSRATLERHAQVFTEALSGLDQPLIAFAVKSNPNLAVLNVLQKQGFGADVVSGGELRRALAAGIAPDKIVFSGVGKTRAELELGLDEKIGQFNIESREEGHELAGIATARGIEAQACLRINPDVDAKTHEKISTGKAENKFGVPLLRARETFAELAALEGMNLRGVAIHIGSQLADLEPLETAFAKVGKLVEDLRAAGHTITHVDLGGGLGVPYRKGEVLPSPADYGAMVARATSGWDVKLAFEPGRVIAGNAGVMLTTALYEKAAPDRSFLIVDAGMNDLMRPALYGAHHDITPLKQAAPDAPVKTYDVVGPICESTDKFASGREMPAVAPGDRLAFMSAGAYGAVLSSAYNTRPLVPEVLVNGDRFDIVRRRPDLEEMLQLEQVPDWLKRTD